MSAERLAEAFRASYGAAPIGVWSAPGRVNLIGEYTDFNLGYVLPFAINRRTWVAVSDRSDDMLNALSTLSTERAESRLTELSAETLHGWSAYVFGVIWALGQFGADIQHRQGLNLMIESDVPVGAGLSSSAALESAVAIALNEHWSLGFDRQTLARIGQLAENKVVGAPTGIMDQSASLLGQRDHAVFLDCQSLQAQAIRLGFADEQLELLVIDTNVSHSHATGGYAARRDSCEAAAAAMKVPSLRSLDEQDLPELAARVDDETYRRARHIVTENTRVLETVQTLRGEGPRAIGALLLASHDSMRDDLEISVPELDCAVETSMAAGAIGARMTGGGFGGAAIALVEHDSVPAVTQAVEAAFAERGFGTPNCFTVTAGDGAHRDY